MENNILTTEQLLVASTGGQMENENQLDLMPDSKPKRRRRSKEELEADPNYLKKVKRSSQTDLDVSETVPIELSPEHMAEISKRIERGLSKTWGGISRIIAKWAGDAKFESDEIECQEMASAFTFYIMASNPAWLADPRFVVLGALGNYVMRRLE